ncbi:MAG: RdgB/HAM1 family non-canonical purine NTP pyrophosphatase [Oscillospiraceae bacterium]|nr:RdgB/HAM1 family non-canonical purine NTP pyrophosphatase [Oscillospiraceae bacterium]
MLTTKILAATNNPDKLIEICRILEPLGVSVISPAEAGVSIEVDETGTTFAENAQLKARAFFEASGLPSLADDSGLCVDALDGRPGLDTAFYQGENASYETRISALVGELNDVPDERRTARFICHLCLVMDGENVLDCEGVCEGMIGHAPKGDGGFGYDPIFYVDGKSMAERPKAEKDYLSHRGRALREFAALLCTLAP